MTPIILTDDQVKEALTPAEAVQVMEKVFLARANGQTVSPPRWEMPFPEGRLTFTAGSVPQGVGFRAYVRGGFAHDDQVVMVWDRESGALKGIVVGEALGVLRTGAIGGVAVKYMSPAKASTLALIGIGRQATSQLACIAAVRPLKEVRVFSRNYEKNEAFCKKTSRAFPDLIFVNHEIARDALKGTEIIVTATTSKTPVVKANWVAKGAHISTLGTKGRRVREVDEAIVQQAKWIATDSPDQAINYPDGTILDGTGQTLLDLAGLIAAPPNRPSDALTLFLSTGLAGTEVALAAHLFEKLQP